METSTILKIVSIIIVGSFVTISSIVLLNQVYGEENWVNGKKLKDSGEFTMKTLDILEEITSNTKISLKVEDIKSTHGPIQGGGVCALVYDKYKAYRYTTGNKVKYEITVPLEGLALPGPSSRIIGVCTGDGNFDKSSYILTFPNYPGIITNLRMTCQDGPCTGSGFIRQISLGVSNNDASLDTNMYKTPNGTAILNSKETNRSIINYHSLVTPKKEWSDSNYNKPVYIDKHIYDDNEYTLLAGKKSEFWIVSSSLQNSGTCQVPGDDNNLYGINHGLIPVPDRTPSLYLYSDMGFCGSTAGTCENGKFYPFTSGQFFIEFETVI